MNNIQEVLDYFSDLTQQSLSAFHLSDEENSLYDDINQLKSVVKNFYKKIRYIEQIGDDEYLRVFTDGTQDKTNFANLSTKAEIPNADKYLFIKELINNESSPIVNLKLENKIKETDWIEITKPSEKIFFL